MVANGFDERSANRNRFSEFSEDTLDKWKCLTGVGRAGHDGHKGWRQQDGPVVVEGGHDGAEDGEVDSTIKYCLGLAIPSFPSYTPEFFEPTLHMQQIYNIDKVILNSFVMYDDWPGCSVRISLHNTCKTMKIYWRNTSYLKWEARKGRWRRMESGRKRIYPEHLGYRDLAGS